MSGFGARALSTITAALSGLQWLLPNRGNDSTTTCSTDLSPVVVSTTMGGVSGHAYSVTLRFRGVVEPKTYTGGTTTGHWNVGGTPAADVSNSYKLQISSPSQTFYLNAGTSATQIDTLDYNETITINGGATVTLTADAIDGHEVRNVVAVPGGGASVAGISSPAQPYAGQFLQMDVVSVI